MKIKFNELDTIFCIDMIIGISMFLLGAFKDPILNHFLIRHHAGFGLFAIIWLSFWGLYTFGVYYISLYYGA